MATQKPGGFWYFILVSSFLAFLEGVHFLSGRTYGDPEENKRILSLVASKSHIIFAVLPVAFGPFQFLPIIRNKWPLVHIWFGRLYSLGVVGGGAFALKASWTANTYRLGHYHFMALTLCWLCTIVQGLRAIWRRDIATHKRWMTRNFILSYAAFVIRVHLIIFMVMGLTDKESLTIASLSSWAPNLMAAELWWYFTDKKTNIN